MTVDIPREIAPKILYSINEKGAYSNISVNKYLEGTSLRSIDRGFITELVYGTVKWKLSIDWVIQQFSSIKLKKISPWVLNILRLGVYQLLYTDRIPASAACNESVALTKKYGHAASSRFVNAVLRNISRNSDNITYPDKSKELIKYLSVRYSHPEWLVKKWLDTFGEDFTESLLDSNNKAPDFVIRVNTLKTTKEELKKLLVNEGLEVSDGKYSEDALIITNPSSISGLDSFKQGFFGVQDESSMLVGKILNPRENDLIIDVCAAPGGKSTHIAQLMKNRGTVISRDIHEHKIKLIEEASLRLGTTIVKPGLFDALEFDYNMSEKADCVLVDAPCTGLGILRRKPDIKWTRDPLDENEIIKLQMKILTNASRYVKPGGTLVYSTCTINKKENEQIVEKFVQESKDFFMDDISPFLTGEIKKAYSNRAYVQLYPNIFGMDGFFIARMKRRE